MSKVWFVTGANSGFGTSIAKAALDAGDQGVATARNMGKLRAAFPDFHGELALIQLDVADVGQAEAAVAEAVARFGRIDVLVNNAGNSYLGNFEELTNADIERQMTTNFYGVVNVLRAALPILRKQRGCASSGAGTSSTSVPRRELPASSIAPLTARASLPSKA